MPSRLAAFRRTPQPTPAQFLAVQFGCWIQYYDDTPARDRSKALTARTFDPDVARRKQEDCCAVCFSLQAFGDSRTKERLLCYRNLGVDVDLVSAAERRVLTPADIDLRKEEYLERHLVPFPLKPHWLVETRHGFHLIFRIKPLRDPEAVRNAEAVNRRLVRALQGDDNAALLTQVLRVPGTFQFKDPTHPFLCRLLLDNAASILPYDVHAVCGVLDALEVFHGSVPRPKRLPSGDGTAPRRRWRELGGVPEGLRNATAASIIGGILCRLPDGLWEIAGWGGLKEWNGKNAVPLPERELRSVFESIARRERAKRRCPVQPTTGEAHPDVQVRVDVRIGTGEGDVDGAGAGCARPPCNPC